MLASAYRNCVAAVSRGIAEQGQPLLGGDAEFALIHREATAAELVFLKGAGTVSRVATLRVMAASEGQATLAEAKVVDGDYPLYGAVGLVGGGTLTDALGLRDDRHGVAVDPLLLARLGIAEGARLRIGKGEFAVRAVIAVEPDRISDGIILGPRLLLSPEALAETGLVVPGSLITWRYRVRLPPPAPVEAVAALIGSAEASFPEAGWRIRSRDAAAQGADRFVSRLGFFLTLVGLSSLIIGGAGIANAVAAFVSRRTASIATLKCLGAPARDIFGIYLTEILLVALLAIGLGIEGRLFSFDLSEPLGALAGLADTARYTQLHDLMDDLPVLTRQHLQTSGPAMRNVPPDAPAGLYVESHTSGSTGQPVTVVKHAPSFAIDFDAVGAPTGVRFIDFCDGGATYNGWTNQAELVAIAAELPDCEMAKP